MKHNEAESGLMDEVFAKVPAAIIVLDARGVVRRANGSAGAMLGESVLEGRKWYEIIRAAFRPRPDDGSEVSTREGRRLQVSTVPLARGQLVQMTDLTATRALRDQISHMERLSSLGKMAASLAHQIRTPLAAAVLYAGNLGNPHLPPAAHARFQSKLMRRLEALEAQINDVLLYARSGEQTAGVLDAVGLLSQVCDDTAAVVGRSGVELERDLGAPPMYVLGNAAALRGALSNLVANAVEAGARRVRIAASQDDRQVVISVADDGPGIPEAIRAKIFEPFYTTKSHGTGLGLAVVAAVAKVHQGRVELTAQPGFPTVFQVIIPRCQPREADRPAAESPAA